MLKICLRVQFVNTCQLLQQRVLENLRYLKSHFRLRYLVCLIYEWEWRKLFYRHNTFSIYVVYSHAQHKKTLPRDHEIYSFVRHFLGHHYYTLTSSEQSPKVEKNIFK